MPSSRILLLAQNRSRRLILCSVVVIPPAREQGCYEIIEWRFSSFTAIVKDLKEGVADRQLFL